HAMELHRFDQHRGRLPAIDREVHEGVLTGVAPQLLELVGIDREVVRFEPATEDDGRQAAGAAEIRDLLAGDLAMLGGEGWTGGGHAEVGSSMLVIGGHGTTR